MKTLFTGVFIFLGLYGNSQKLDYRKMRDTICPPICGWRDSLSLSEIVPRMLALDTNMLTKDSRSEFFDDLAHQEFMLFAYTLDSNYLRSSANHSSKATYNDPKSYGNYWNTAFAYSMLNECEKMRYWLAQYKERTPRKYLRGQLEQIGYLEEKCK